MLSGCIVFLYCIRKYIQFPKIEGKLLAKGFLVFMNTRKYFDTKFIKENKLSFSSCIILQDIYSWLFSKNPPIIKKINEKKFYFISQTHIAEYNEGLLNRRRIGAIFDELKKVGIIESTIIVDYHFHYVSFNWNIIKESILNEEVLTNMENNEWWKNAHRICDENIAKEKKWKETHGDPDDLLNQGYEIVVKNGRNYLVKKKESKIKASKDESMLLSEEDMGIKSKYCQEADAIARLILKRYNCYFNHKVPEEGVEPTKTYVNLCNKITDIYNGTFIKSRFYPLSEKFLNNSQFNIEGWKDKIKEVQGDWLKVKKLILNSMRNFMLMHDENRMPYSKGYLQTNLNLFFYDNVSNRDEPQSQFILSLFEPEYTTKHHSELKADKIFDSLNNVAKKGGNRLFSLNENMPSGLFWQRIKEMIEWGKLAFNSEPNIQYWLMSPNDLPNEFAKYCEEKEISVSVHTLDIKKAVNDNSPWTWFVKDMSIKHGLNSHLSELVTKEDFKKCYKKDKLTFDDLEDVVF